MQNKSSSTYSEKLKDPRWQRKRLQIFDRDKWRCQVCDDDTKTLNVHHLEYNWKLEPWEYNNDELITICEYHHNVISQCRMPKLFLNLWIENKSKFKPTLPKDKFLNCEKLDELFKEFIKNIVIDLKEVGYGKSTA